MKNVIIINTIIIIMKMQVIDTDLYKLLLQAFTKAVDRRFVPNINGNTVPK